MRSSFSSRLYIAIIYGCFAAWWWYKDKIRWNHAGLQNFLEAKRKIYETSFAHVAPWPVTLIAALILMLSAWFLFELLAFGLSLIRERSSR